MPLRHIDDTRIQAMRPLLPPAILIEELPVAGELEGLVAETRQQVGRIIHGRDDRLVVLAGPCSIHDTVAALDYASRLALQARRFADELLIVMRVYFEKPRTVVGWKGLINDPFLDGSFQINKGLRLARGLLRDINALGLPTGTEFLDTIIPQFIADLVSWAAIGARTTESQVHRELASGLSMPVGFKNATSGDVRVAVDAVLAARHPHWFPSVTKQGVSAIFATSGNNDCHVILRGGATGPNFDRGSVARCVEALQAARLSPQVMVDCSHANSFKDYRRQGEAAKDVAAQIAEGSTALCGVMLESHLVEGRQDHKVGHSSTYGQSVTDACISWEQTVPILEMLAEAVKRRRTLAKARA